LGERAGKAACEEVVLRKRAGDRLTGFPEPERERPHVTLGHYTGSSANTFSGLRQSVTSKINAWLNPYVDAATSESDFDLSEFRDKRISLYLGVSPDDLERVAPIYGLLFQQLIDRNVRELPKDGKHQIKVLLALDEFASLGKCTVLANAFSYVAGYGLRMLPAFQSLEQIQGVYGDKVAADIERNCAVRLVLRPAALSEAKKISDQLGSYTYKARSRSMGTWGGGGGSTSESDQRRPLMLPQEVELLPENDLIVFRRGMYATYGKKVRYYAEKHLIQRTKIPAPQMPPIRVDPAIAANSLRVIEATQVAETAPAAPATPGTTPAPEAGDANGAATSKGRKLNQAAINDCLQVQPKDRVRKLFQGVCLVHDKAA
jgi:type IV secretion system protein VirD4